METNQTHARGNAIVRERFDLQAKRFDDWQITGDEELLASFFGFAGLTATDSLLDVACGTGRFSVYAAQRIKSAAGVDLSAGMVEVARSHASSLGLTNAEFFVQEGEGLPFAENTFSVVTSKAAFHHMPQYKDVFAEMVRCCRRGGTVCLQDIVAYDDPYVDRYFERLEFAIDVSHHRTRKKREIYDLFKSGSLGIARLFETESMLDLEGYIAHATQDVDDVLSVAAIVEEGLRDPAIQPYLVERSQRMHFKRRVFVIAGTKPE